MKKKNYCQERGNQIVEQFRKAWSGQLSSAEFSALFKDSFVFHYQHTVVGGVPAYVEFIQQARKPASHLDLIPEIVLSNGDWIRLYFRWTAKSWHKDIVAGSRFSNFCEAVFRIEDGKIAEKWEQSPDFLFLLGKDIPKGVMDYPKVVDEAYFVQDNEGIYPTEDPETIEMSSLFKGMNDCFFGHASLRTIKNFQNADLSFRRGDQSGRGIDGWKTFAYAVRTAFGDLKPARFDDIYIRRGHRLTVFHRTRLDDNCPYMLASSNGMVGSLQFDVENSRIQSLYTHAENYISFLGTDFSQHQTRTKNLFLGQRDALDQGSTSFAQDTPRKETAPESMKAEPVAIIGMAGKFPQCDSIGDYWEALVSGRNLFTQIPEDRAFIRQGTKIQYAGFINDIFNFDARFFNIPPVLAEYVDPQQRLLMETIIQCIDDSGHKTSDYAGPKTALFVSTLSDDYKKLLQDSGVPLNTNYWAGNEAAMFPSKIARFLDIQGPCQFINTECTSSLVAIHEACRLIRDGEVDQVIVGAANLFLHPYGFHVREETLLSQEPSPRLFSSASTGQLRAEAVVSIVLKSLEKAVADKDEIYGVVAGSAVNNSGRTFSIAAANIKQQAAVISDAWRKASVDPSDVSLIECHASGVREGDFAEIKAIQAAFGQGRAREGGEPCVLTAAKGAIGHAEAASGLTVLVKTLLQFRHRLIIATQGLADIDDALELDHSSLDLAREHRPWPNSGTQAGRIPRVVGINGFAAGGYNAHVVIKEYVADGQEMEAPTFQRAEVVVLSARTENSLARQIRQLKEFLSKSPDINLAHLAYTLQIGREHMEHRIAFVVSDAGELAAELALAQEPHRISPKAYAGRKGRYRQLVVPEACTPAEHIKFLVSNQQIAQLAEFWSQGYPIPWEDLHQGKSSRRLAGLPTYQFERERYGVPESGTPSRAEGSAAFANAPRQAHEAEADHARLTGTYFWKEEPLAEEADAVDYSTHQIFLCGMRSLAPAAIESGLAGAACFELASSGSVEAQYLEHSIRVLDAIKELFRIQKRGRHLLQIVVPSEGSGQIFAALSGLLNTARKENPKIIAQLIQTPSSERADDCIRKLVASGRQPAESHIRYDQNKRYVYRVREVPLLGRADPPWKDNGVYLITGGMGRLGLLFAEDISRKSTAATLILVDRGDLSEERADHLKRLRLLGSNVEYAPIDIGNDAQVVDLVHRVVREHGGINGIIHAAGVLRDSYIPEKSAEQVKDVFAPKVSGTIHLDQATRGLKLDFFVLFSSISTLGNPGQADYSAANEFLNSYASYRNGLASTHAAGRSGEDPTAPYGRTLSINWPLWKNGGMRIDDTEIAATYRKTGVGLLSSDAGIQALYQGLASKQSQLLVFEGDAQKIRQFYFPNEPGSEEYEICCFEESWHESPLPAPTPVPAQTSHLQSRALVCFLADQDGRASLAEALAPLQHGQGKIVFVAHGNGYEKKSVDDYQITGTNPRHLEALFEEIKKDLGEVDGILYLWTYDDVKWIRDVASILYIVQALASTKFRAKRLLLAAQFDDPLDRCHLESWIGFERSLGLVLPNTKVAVVLREEEPGSHSPMAAMGGILARELGSKVTAATLYRHGVRHVLRTRSVRPGIAGEAARRGGTYLITGGLGGLGFIFAKHLASQCPVNLVLTGRSALDDAKREKIKVLESLQGQVLYLQADVSDPQGMGAGLKEARNRFGELNGVIHAAGLQSTNGLFKNISEFQQVTGPKIEGTLVLDRLVANEPLDFICYFSSSAAVLGDGGACDYAVGNRFMMSYAQYRNELQSQGKCKGRATVVNWPLWKDGGMVFGTEEETKFYLKSSGQRYLETQEGLELFDKLLASERTQHLVLVGKPGRLHRFLGMDSEQSSAPEPKAASGSPAGGRLPGMEGLALDECLLLGLKDQVARLLKFNPEHLDAQTNLADFGFDSISLAEFARALTEQYGADISPALFFSYSNLEKLAGYLVEEHAELIERYYRVATTEPSEPSKIPEESEEARILRRPEACATAKSASNGVPEDIAIIGMSGRFPQARTIEEMWRILLEGRCAIREVPADRFDWREWYGNAKEDPTKTNCKWMGALPGVAEFDPSFFEIAAQEARCMDPRQRLLLQEAWRALEDAGYGTRQISENQIGIFVGVEEGDYGARFQNGSVTSNHNGILAARLAYFLDLHGPSMAINTTCSSGLVAAHQAILNLRSDECDTAVVAGVHTLCSPRSFVGMSQAGMLSSDGVSFAFDNRANGMVPGEAVAVLVLRKLSDAEAAGDPIHAVIRASGINYDGKTNGMAAPSGASQAQLIKGIYQKSQIKPDEIEYVVAHGTGTKLGDAVELNALYDAFKSFTSRSNYCALTSNKGNFGHTFAASGLMSVISLVEALKHECIPASLNYDRGNEYAHWRESPFYVNTASKPWPKKPEGRRMGAVSAFGMGGTNAHMVVQEYVPDGTRGGTRTPAQSRGSAANGQKNNLPFRLIVISAKTRKALDVKVQEMMEALQARDASPADLADISYTLQQGRHHFAFRVAVVVQDVDSALEAWRKIAAGKADPCAFQGEAPRELSGRISAEQLRNLLPPDERETSRSTEQYRAALSALAGFYCQGYDIEWEPLYDGEAPRKISLPTYPFSREHYWVEAGQVLDVERNAAPENFRRADSQAVEAHGHSEGHSIIVDGEKADFFEEPNPWARRLDAAHPILQHHTVHGHKILPGLAYIDLLYQLFRQKGYDYRELEIRNLSIYQPLIVDQGQEVPLYISCREIEAAQAWKVQIELRGQGVGAAEKRFAVAEVLRREPCQFEDQLDVFSLSTAGSAASPLAESYEKCRARGLVHTGIMKAEGAIKRLETADLLSVSVPQAALADADRFMFHPALIDGSAIGIGELFFEQHSSSAPQAGVDSGEPLHLPLFYESFRASDLLQTRCVARVRKSEFRQKNDLIHLNVEFFNEAGRKVGELKNLVNKLVREERMLNPGGMQTALGRVANESGARSQAAARSSERPPVDEAAPSNGELAGTERLSRVKLDLRNILASVLQVSAEDVDTHVGYFDMGLDSVMLLDAVTGIERRYSISLTPTLLFEHTTIDQLSAYLCRTHENLSGEAGANAARAAFSDASGGLDQEEKSLPAHSPASSGKAPVSTSEEKQPDGVAVIGLSGRYPGADNIDEFWNNLKAGQHAVTEVPEDRWDWHMLEGFRSPSGKQMSRWGGFVNKPDHFDAKFFGISPQEARTMDPQERLFLEVCWETIEDAGYTPANLTSSRGQGGRRDVGVFVGVMNKDYAFIGAEALARGDAVPLSLSHAPIANRISYVCNFHGPSMTIDTVCSASLTAVHLAMESIQRGECRVALAGGVSLSLHPNKYITHGMLDMHSSDGRCRSFAEGGDGYVSGEGVGAVLLKPVQQAMQDKDHIYAVIKGSSINHGGKVSGMAVPSPAAQADMMHNCLERTGINPRTISYVEAHGTGTSLGDPIEVQGLMGAFDRFTSDRQFCAIGSVKSNIGHAESAAGISGLTKVILQLYHKTLVPSLHSESANPLIDFKNSAFFVQREVQAWNRPVMNAGKQQQEVPRRAAVSSFGATGSNACVILEEYAGAADSSTGSGTPLRGAERAQRVVVPLSAKNVESLKDYARRLLEFVRASQGRSVAAEGRHGPAGELAELREMAYTLQTGREAMEERFAVLVKDKQELCEKLEAFVRGDGGAHAAWQGQAGNSRRIARVLTPEDLERLVSQWVAQDQLHKMAELWVQGFNVNWAAVWSGSSPAGKPSRIRLPTYPFSRERYWIDVAGGRAKFDAQPAGDTRASAARPTSATSAHRWSFAPQSQVQGSNAAHSDLDVAEKARLFVQQLVADHLKISVEDVDCQQRFFELGLESAAIVEAAQEIKAKINSGFLPSLFFEYETISDLSSHLASLYPADFARLRVTKAEVVAGAPGECIDAERRVNQPGEVKAVQSGPDRLKRQAVDVFEELDRGTLSLSEALSQID